MNFAENRHPSDWEPSGADAPENQELLYDEMRRRCPVAYSQQLGWTLFGHADVMRVLLDHETFSNAVSQHVSVPNGMDAPQHTPYRKIIEKYFAPERMAAFEPICRKIAADLVGTLKGGAKAEFVNEVAVPFASAVQCAFLGWPDVLRPKLASWLRENQEATLAQNRKKLSEKAAEFEAIIDELLAMRRADLSINDITAELMRETVRGRQLSTEEVASILRNWTAGEIGTISAAAGILAWFLALHPELQQKLREDGPLLSYAISEILRIHGPLVMNRRVTKRPVEIGGKKIGAGERISINWISANRDEEVFETAHEFRFGRDQSKNLLYGAGIHVCPGAPLAHLEMRVFLEELLNATAMIRADEAPVYARFPASGFARLPLVFE